MQAVILAGGLGTRLRPLTLTRPKPLLPVANVPLLDRLLASLPEDVDRAVVAGGYRMDDIAAYYEDHDPGVELVLREEPEPMGTAGALKFVEDDLDGPFLVLNGDVLSSLDLAALERFHRDHDGVGTLALWKVEDPTHFGVVEMEGDRILRFVEKPPTREEAPSDLANAGTYLLEPEVLDRVPAGRKVSIERETFPALLEEDLALHGLPFAGWWVDCGRPATYLRAHELVLKGEGHRYALGEDAVIDGSHLEGWVSLGDGAVLAPGARAARAVLLPRARVEADAVVRDTILGEGAIVGEGALVVDAVLADGARVPPGAEVEGERVEDGETATTPGGAP